jgi:23S rRNA-/tRNA-specific pseudouridylate synthase
VSVFVLSLLLVKNREATQENNCCWKEDWLCIVSKRRGIPCHARGKARDTSECVGGAEEMKNTSCALVSAGREGYGDPGLTL